MTNDRGALDPIEAIAALDEPNRQRLYELVAGSSEPIGRDDAAAALGISRELAAFHLDRLVAVGLLEAQYRRRGVRKGPGGGRPAKLYRRSADEVTVSLPPRRYEIAADDMATALDRLNRAAAASVAADVARERGLVDGIGARRAAGRRLSRRRRGAVLVDALREVGYEPQVDPSTGTVSLRNCPYHALAAGHRNLTCGMNLAWAEGLAAGLGAPFTVELAPEDGRCCVLFHPGPDRDQRS
jgi:predicted ArsR family transcriptional regulator